MFGLNPVQGARLHVTDVHRAALVPGIGDSHRRTIQAQSDGGAVDIEFGVVEISEHHVVHGMAGCHLGDQAADQKTGDGGIAIGEMVDVGLVEGGCFRIIELSEL